MITNEIQAASHSLLWEYAVGAIEAASGGPECVLCGGDGDEVPSTGAVQCGECGAWHALHWTERDMDEVSNWEAGR